MRRDELRCLMDVPRAKSQQTSAQLCLRYRRDFRPRRQPMPSGDRPLGRLCITPRVFPFRCALRVHPRSVPRGEQRHHLFDLHDLLGRAAQKSQQGLAERLPQNPQPRKRRDAARQMRVAAPRQGIRQLPRIAVSVEISTQRQLGVRGRRRPFQLTACADAQARHVAIPLPQPNFICFTLPTKRLSAVDRFGEYGRIGRRRQRERLPVRPTVKIHGAGFDHRKLCWLASSRPSALITLKRQATAWVFRPAQSGPVRPTSKTVSFSPSVMGNV